MRFLLDTDICSAHLKQKGLVSNRFLQHSGGLCISAITLAELYVWVLRANAPATRMAGLQSLLSDVHVLDVTAEVAHRFGQVNSQLSDSGKPAPKLDLLIAATALVHDLSLVTHNTADYVNVPNLRLVDWLA
ncbi:MAG TPA: type II toxin-antitoxin system VapC family toxin [Tepidisphaeraceae bacterium]|jgi:predicted nucleic acid-binding protein